MIPLAIASDVASFGAAGLMGAMWLAERRLSRTREEQLQEAHARIVRDEERLEKLTQVVEHNTSALARFSETQRQVADTLRELVREFHHDRIH